MAKLTAARRKKLKAKSFAGPERSYPVHDRRHAANALSRASQHASGAKLARIRAVVCKRYPDLPKCKEMRERSS